MGTEANSALPVALSSYLRTVRGLTVSPELRERLATVLAPDQLGPLVRTVDDVHAVRDALEQLALLRAGAENQQGSSAELVLAAVVRGKGS